MTKPNINVVIALFESYLTIRKTDWNLEELQNGNVRLPDPNSWEGKKIAVCNEILQIILNMNPNSKRIDIKEWIHLVQELHDHEVNQAELYKGQWFGKQHVLLDAIRAIRSYIITCLVTDDQFTNTLRTLKETQKKHEADVDRLEKHKEGHNPNELIESQIELKKTNKALESVTIGSDFLNDFFVDQIMVNDPKYIELKEADIHAYKKNAEEGKRPGTLCRKVTESMKKVMQVPANSNAAAATATDKKEAASSASTTPPKTDTATVVKEEPFTPAASDKVAKDPKAPRGSKSSRSALRDNSKFASAPQQVAMTESPPPQVGYNTRSKNAPSRSKH